MKHNTVRPHRTRPGIQRGALFVVFWLALMACADPASEGSSDRDEPTQGSVRVEQLESEVLAEDFAGPEGVTFLVSDRTAYASLLADIGLSESRVPLPDFERSVAIYFGTTRGSACDGEYAYEVYYRKFDRRLYPLPILVSGEGGCNDDANDHGLLVAVPKDALPAERFTIWVSDRSQDCCDSAAVVDPETL